ncbi:PP2C family protein-serine/threonine phosphatase [Streptomyces sp. NPDC060243]|uniref:PP2C family protein-serine/threonine phosphatase n=1 Tax=Streptomyces sp. NPDC060243 TaxID=3347081 RepID=UPI00365A407B
MSTPPAPKVAGTHSPNPSSAHNADTPAESSADASLPSPASAPGAGESRAGGIPARASLALQERLASWLLDLSTLHELSERLHRTRTTEDALCELLRAGAVLLGAERGLVRFTHAAAHPARLHGHGLDRGELGRLEALPEECTSHGALLAAGTGAPVTRRDLLAEPGLDPRCAAVARSLGCAATYAVPLCDAGRVFASALWSFPEPTAPSSRQSRLLSLYAREAASHLVALGAQDTAVRETAALRAHLGPGTLPRVPGARLAGRWLAGPGGAGSWYEALTLPDGGCGLAVGTASGDGPEALAAAARLRGALRAYAVLQGEDPAAVLADLELVLRLSEPGRSATALYAHLGQDGRRLRFAGAGHAPPLLIGPRRVEYLESTVSAPLTMLSCWEAPSVEVRPEPGESLVFYTDGLLRATGDTADRAFARLHAAAASSPLRLRRDPGALADHLLGRLLPERALPTGEDLALLVLTFD